MPNKFIQIIVIATSLLASTGAISQQAIDSALITSLHGSVDLVTPQGKQPLQAFTKLKRGDLLALGRARGQLVYFESGRQEIWNGGGRLEVLGTESRAFGLANPEVKMLSVSMVRQIARTPAPDSQGRGGVVRTRAIASPEAIAKLESSYRQLRMEAVRGDLNPELYLLSGLFEMREIERVEQLLRDLQQSRPGDTEVGLVVALYQKAIKNARESRPR
ncbi:hypothetical protein RHDC4_02589 [Rhodocyclaceae bacterium]|nr:hypothetical protein RHDC4_02589 [Rhodocyclaceae bacterium]